MVKDLLLNFMMLAVIVIVSARLFIPPAFKARFPWLYRVGVGVFHGCSGSLLILFGIDAGLNHIMDMRPITVLLAAYLGGEVSALIALIVMLAFRAIPDPAVWLRVAVDSALVLIGCAAVMRRIRGYWRQWLLLISCSLTVVFGDLFVVSGLPFRSAVAPVMFALAVGGLFAAFLLRHFLRTDDWKRELQRVRNELSNIIKFQSGFTFSLKRKDGRVVYTMIEGQLLRQLGVDPVNVVGRPVETLAVLPEEMRNFLKARYEEAWQGEKLTYESELRSRNLMTTLQPVFENGEVGEVIGSSVDITERKAAENRIKESEERYKTLVEHSQDAIIGFHADGAIASVNKQACNICNAEDTGQAVGRKLRDLLPSLDVEIWDENFRKVASEPTTRKFEMLLFLNGIERDFRVTLSSHGNVGGILTGITGTLHDISDLKRRQEADKANREKTRFLARMSHEIRTPLNGIIGLSHILIATKLSFFQKEYVQKIVSSSNLLLGLINDILDMSRVEAGKLRLERTAFQLDAMLLELASTIGVLTDRKQIELIMDTDERLPMEVVGDPLRVKQVLLNLCSNAIKFTDNGCVSVKVEIVGRDDRTITLRFQVEDTGIGMTAHQLQLLFEPFWQAEQANIGKVQGTGLGLPIAKQLIQMMGGEISVESWLGEGSTFEFMLDFGLAGSGGPHSWKLPVRSGPLHMLIVEDHERVQGALTSILESFSCKVTTVSCWEDMFAILGDGRNRLFDGIVLDMETDDMYGEHTWGRLTELIGDTEMMIIALTTAIGREEILGVMGEHRADAMLTKPVSRIEMFNTLKYLLAHKGSDDHNAWVKSRDLPDERNAKDVRKEEATEDGRDSAKKPEPFGYTGEQLSGEQSGLQFMTTARDQDSFLPWRVLVVEDNEINRLVVTAILTRRGFRVALASNGEEALERIEREPYDLVLMDIYMPGMDGCEAARRIRAIPAHRSLPILALTANAVESEYDSYYEAGINDIVLKPLDADKMVYAIEKWLLLRTQEQGVESSAEVAASYSGEELAKGSSEEAEGAAKEDAKEVVKENVKGDVKEHAKEEVKEHVKEQAPLDALLSLDGIDEVRLLQRLDGKRAIMLQILAKFKREYANYADHVRGLLKEGRIGAALLASHTLIGVARNLSAQELAAVAIQLEETLLQEQEQEEPTRSERLLDEVDRQLQRIIRSIPE